MKSLNLLLLLFIVTAGSLIAESGKYRLVYRGNPSTNIVVGWDQLNGENHRVYYDTEDHAQDTAAYAFMKTPDRVEEVKGMTNTFARLESLEPNTRYYFVVCDDSYISERMWFRTIPDDPTQRLSLIFGGDSRSNPEERRYANEMVAKLRPHAVVFGGDYVDDGTEEEWDQWFDDWQLTIADDGRCTPLIATQGNHELIWTNFPEGNDVIDKLFDTSGEEHYFAFSLGGNLLRLYSLDAEYPTSSTYGEQTTWFENDLSQNAGNHVWLAAQYHSPVRPHNSDKMEGFKQYNEWVPLFDQYDFAFVQENDAHLCKQTWPVRKSSGDESEEGFVRDDFNGTVYTGEGGWGAPLRDNDDNKSWTRDSDKVNQFKWVFINQDTIEIRTVLTDSVENVSAFDASDNIFTMPQGISLWEPPNGSVIIIQKYTTPQCSITYPYDGTHYDSPQIISVEAGASDPHGIQEVSFYVNGTAFGTDTEAPYAINYELPYEGMFFFSARAVNNQGVNSPASDVISVTCGDPSNTINIVTDNDAEENLENGQVDTESGDLELTRESGILGLNDYNQLVGIRFENIALPQDAVINSAYVQFSVDETNNMNPCELSIRGEAADNSVAFSSEDEDISSRELTDATVIWTPPEWENEGAQATAQQTPDISDIIYEIINRPGWTPSNDLSIIISGDGRRTASAGDAELIIDYQVNLAPEVSLNAPTDQSVYDTLETISIEATASDYDGQIENVSFYVEGELAGTDDTAPYQQDYSIPYYGTFEIYAVAVDDQGGESTSEHIQIKATTPPQVEMICPASDTTVDGLPEIALKASAFDEIGYVESVSFYSSNNNLIATVEEAPWHCNWTVPYYGSFDLNAVAVDDDGISSASETSTLLAEIDTYSGDVAQPGITVYPNPVHRILTIQFGKKISREKSLVVIYDISHNVLMQQKIKASSDNKIRIDMSPFTPGAYLLQVKSANYNLRQKLIRN